MSFWNFFSKNNKKKDPSEDLSAKHVNTAKIPTKKKQSDLEVLHEYEKKIAERNQKKSNLPEQRQESVSSEGEALTLKNPFRGI